MSERIVSIPCPSCGHRVAGAGICAECGLDATLLFAIRRSAETLAWKGVRQAGEGRWQEAYDAAAESLRLMANDNDLAAFVVLTSSLAGARGTVRKIAKPEPQRLPAELRGPLEELLTAVEEVRSLLHAEDDEEAVRKVRELQEGHPGLGLFSLAGSQGTFLAAAAPRAPREARRPRLALVAATILLAVLGGWIEADWFGRRGRQERSDLELKVQALEVQLQQRRADPAPLPAQDPWLTALAGLDRPEAAHGNPATGVREVTGRVAWRKGRTASRAEHYEEARRWLELAIQGPSDSDYRDDALYYLAKAYHRLGQRERAAELYEQTMREAAPGSNLVPEAQRLLARLQLGEGVDR